MKRRKSITYSLLIALTLATTCCIGEHDSFWGFGSGELQVSAYYASAEAYQTRSTADSLRTDSVATDTLYINDQTCMTTRVTDLITDLPFGTAPATVPADTLGGTRGTPADTPDQLTSMNVVMFNTGSTDYVKETSTATDLFTVTATKGDFVLDKSYSWTAGSSDKHTFLAFAPKTGTAGVTLSADKKSVTYTVPATTADQPDLCVSDYTNNDNIVNSTGSNNHNQRFALQHALTAIGFEAVGYDVRITRVTLKGASTTGTLNLTTRAWSAFANPADRQPGINTATWLMCENKDQMVNLTNADGYLMMIPQTLTDAITLVIEYEGRNQQVGTGSYTVKLRDAGETWTAGKKIVYQLRLKTKPAVDNNALTLTDPRGGYTTLHPLNIAAATDDNLTFSWAEPWLRIYRGNPGYVNPAAGGAPSGWSTGVNNWNNLYFFANADNPSTAAARTATVTVTGKKSGRRTFTVTQDKMVALNMAPTTPGEVIPIEGKTYTVGITSNTTWLGTEQTGATLSPASGNGNNNAVRVVVPKNASWKESQVKVTVNTTNTTGPILTRTWTGTQPGMPVTQLRSSIRIYDAQEGYVASVSTRFNAADDDELTFTWNESWLKVYSGNYTNTVNPATTGSGSGFKANASQWNNLWFFAVNSNGKEATRTATVTVKSKSGSTNTFSVEQNSSSISLVYDYFMDGCAGYVTPLVVYSAPGEEWYTLTSAAPEKMKLCVMNPAQQGAYFNPALAQSSIRVRGADLKNVCFVPTGAGGTDAINCAIVNEQGDQRTPKVQSLEAWSMVELKPYTFVANPSSQTYVATQSVYLLSLNETSSMRQPGLISVECSFKDETNYPYGKISKSWLDNDWFEARYVNADFTLVGFKLNFNVTMKRNIVPAKRYGTATYKVTYKGRTETRTRAITQEASDYFYLYNSYNGAGMPMENLPKYAWHNEVAGRHYWGEDWCVRFWGDGWRLPSPDAIRIVKDIFYWQWTNYPMATNLWIYDYRLVSGWTDERSPNNGPWGMAQSWAYWMDWDGTRFTYSRKEQVRKSESIYRCIKQLY